MNNRNEFIIISEEIKGNVIVKENTQFNNIDAETIIIEENVVTRLFGTIQRNVTLKKGSRVYVHGEIKGNVDNNGGKLLIFNN